MAKVSKLKGLIISVIGNSFIISIAIKIPIKKIDPSLNSESTTEEIWNAMNRLTDFQKIELVNAFHDLLKEKEVDYTYTQFQNIIINLAVNFALNIIISPFVDTEVKLGAYTYIGKVAVINPSYKDVMNGNWDYEKFIGRQLNFLTVGIIGYGRLGKYYAKYCRAFGSKILIYDPYIKKSEKNHEFKNLDYLLKNSDILALHIHADKENYKFMNKKKLSRLKKNVAIINTSRGEVIDESSLVDFLKKNKKAKVATDVLIDEIRNRLKSRLLKYAKKNQNQVLITPHIGGMTTEGQNIAYNAVVKKLERFFNG